MLQRFSGVRVIEDLLEGCIDALRLADLLHRAAVVAGVCGRRLLRIQDEGLQRSQVGQAVVARRVTEDNAIRVSSSNSTNRASWIDDTAIP